MFAVDGDAGSGVEALKRDGKAGDAADGLLVWNGFSAAARKTSARPALVRSVKVSFCTVMVKSSPRVLVRVRRSSRMLAISRSAICALSRAI